MKRDREEQRTAGRRQGGVVLLIQEGSKGNVPSGKQVANIIVNSELIYCLGGHESKALIVYLCICVHVY